MQLVQFGNPYSCSTAAAETFTFSSSLEVAFCKIAAGDSVQFIERRAAPYKFVLLKNQWFSKGSVAQEPVRIELSVARRGRASGLFHFHSTRSTCSALSELYHDVSFECNERHSFRFGANHTRESAQDN